MKEFNLFTRGHSIAGVAVILVGTGLLVILLLQYNSRPPLLNTIPIGVILSGSPADNAVAQIDGRAFVVDDGVIERITTIGNSGRPSLWSGPATGTILRIINMRTGRVVRSVTLDAAGGVLVPDPSTQRVFRIDPNMQQIDMIDARKGVVLNPPPWPTWMRGTRLVMNVVNAALVSPRSGHVFLAMANVNSLSTPVQALVMLDGHTGRTLRILPFLSKSGTIAKVANGNNPNAYSTRLSLTLDHRSGYIYVFDPTGWMTVVDGVSGKILWSRRLHVNVTGGVLDGRNGHIFAFGTSKDPTPSGKSIVRLGDRLIGRIGSVLAINAMTGAIVRQVHGGTNWITSEGIALDDTTNHVFVADPLSDSLSVLDAATGRILRTIAIGTMPVQIASDPSRHRLLVITGGGRNAKSTIVVVDTRNSTVLRTIPLEQPASLLAVDTLSGHLLLSAFSLQPALPDPWNWLPSWLRTRIPAIPSPAASLGPSQRFVYTTLLVVDPSSS